MQKRARDAQPLNGNGGDRYHSDNYNTDTPLSQGTSATYLTARIARDRPDILERMKQIANEVAALRTIAAERAKKRQVASGKNYGRGAKVQDTCPEPNGKARDEVGEQLGISGRTVDDLQAGR